MGIPILVLGASGSGKSASLRNFKREEIGIFNVAGKPLPFRNDLRTFKTSDVNVIQSALTNPKSEVKVYVIDDSQYLMAFEMFSRAKETGFNKFTDIALNFYNLIQTIITQTPDDVIVYFLHHTEITDTGHTKIKTIGKMLDNQLTLEGLFSVVLLAKTDGQSHTFVTQSNGYTPCKTPMGMFEMAEIENDLKMVDTVIREYWNIKSENKKEKK